MELREPLVGGGLGDATVVVRLSTDSVGKAGVAEPWIPCLARVCGVVGRRADFVGDGRAVGLRPEPLRVSAYRLPSLPQRPLQHPCASAPVPAARPGAERQAHSPRHACCAGTQDWHAPANGRGIRAYGPLVRLRSRSEPGAPRSVWWRVLLGVSRNRWAWLKACAV